MRECIREGITPFVDAGWGNSVHVNVVCDKELVQHFLDGGRRFFCRLKTVEFEPLDQLDVLSRG